MNKRVVICERCGGDGTVSFSERRGHAEVEFKTMQCPRCKGAGRLVEVSWSKILTITDYDRDYENLGERMCQPRANSI